MPFGLRIVDIDDQATWPSEVFEIAAGWAKQNKGCTTYIDELSIPPEAEKQFRALLAGCLVRAYHCTRLLPHEIAMVQTAGLRPLSADLLRDRIRAAHAAGVITAIEADRFHASHVFATGEQAHRDGQVCLILSKQIFREDPSGCEPLLATWGGEGLYRSSGGVVLRDRLMQLGSPAVVTALLQISNPDARHLVFPALHEVFVAAVLQLPRRWADVFYKAPIPPEHIELIAQPGSTGYALLGDLPLK